MLAGVYLGRCGDKLVREDVEIGFSSFGDKSDTSSTLANVVFNTAGWYHRLQEMIRSELPGARSVLHHTQ
jgi:hypothetical protein